jgi:hypothetical protein
VGKAARNRGIRAIAVAATIGKSAEVTDSVARRLRREALERRRARPKTRRSATSSTSPAPNRPSTGADVRRWLLSRGLDVWIWWRWVRR